MIIEPGCAAVRARLIELADAEPADAEPADATRQQAAGEGPVDAVLAKHAVSCAACAAELRLTRDSLSATRALARGSVPEPSEAYWESFLPSVRSKVAMLARLDARSPARRPGRALAAAAAVVMIAGAAASFLAPPPAPDEKAALLLAGERMGRVMSPDPRLSGEAAADLLDVDPMPGIAAGEIVEALRDIAPLPAPTGTWPGVADGELERSIDQLDKERAQRLVAELSAFRG